MHEVLVNCLGGLSLPRKSVVRLTFCRDMTLDVYRGSKRTNQQQQQSREGKKRSYRQINVVFRNSYLVSKAQFHVTVTTQVNKSVVYFIVRRNVKFGCSEC